MEGGFSSYRVLSSGDVASVWKKIVAAITNSVGGWWVGRRALAGRVASSTWKTTKITR